MIMYHLANQCVALGGFALMSVYMLLKIIISNMYELVINVFIVCFHLWRFGVEAA